MKPGYATSELYTTQGSAGALFTIVLTEPNVWVKCAALIAIGLVQFGYAISRGLEKSAVALEKES